MKTKIYLTTMLLLAVLCSQKTIAQCSVTITGDSCINKTLTAVFTADSTDLLNELTWKFNGHLAYTTSLNGYNPQYIIAAMDGAMAGGNAIFVDDSDNVFVAIPGTMTVEKHGFDGTITVIANLSFIPRDLCVVKDTLYVTGTNADSTVKAAEKWAIGASTGTRIAGTGTTIPLSNPKGIFADRNGTAYISDPGNTRVIKILSGSTKFTPVAGNHGGGSAANQLKGNLGVKVDKDGNVFVVDASNSRVQKWAPGATSGVTVAGGNGSGAAANQLYAPTYLALAKTGDLFIAESSANRVSSWKPGATSGTTVAGGYTIIGQDSSFHLYTPWGVAIDNAGNLFVSDKRDATKGWVKEFPRWNKIYTSYQPKDIGSYSVTAVSAGNCIASYTTTVKVKPSEIDSLTGPDKVDMGALNLLFKVYAKQKSAVTYNWAVPEDATIVSGQGTTTMRVNWGSTAGAVKVYASNHCGQTSLVTKKVKVRGHSFDAIAADDAIAGGSVKFVAYPNPAKDKIQVQTKGITIVTLSDQYGKTVLTQKINLKGEINVSHLPAGMYYITDNTTRQTLKVMIVK